MNAFSDYLLPESARPEWLTYPPQLTRMVSEGKVDITPWHIMKFEWVAKTMSGLLDRYGRNVVPFAHRQNNDDVAVFEKGSVDKVLVIHDFADRGSEIEEVYPDFQTWLDSAEAESRDWNS
ncbi:MAG: hypothetical protein JWP91_3030 [Fibrobacteres bacterium]|nr:hypothetical protein [Fibrobacterota bacterium]